MFPEEIPDVQSPVGSLAFIGANAISLESIAKD